MKESVEHGTYRVTSFLSGTERISAIHPIDLQMEVNKSEPMFFVNIAPLNVKHSANSIGELEQKISNEFDFVFKNVVLVLDEELMPAAQEIKKWFCQNFNIY